MLNIWRKTRKPPVDNPKRNAFFWVLGYTGDNDISFEICRWNGKQWVNNYGDMIFVYKWKKLKA